MKPWKRIFLTFFFFIFSTDIYPIVTNFLKRKEKSSPKIESNRIPSNKKRTSNLLSSFAFIHPALSFTDHNTLFTPFLHPLSLQIERILGQKPSINRTNPFFSSQRCFEFSRLKSKERERQRSEKLLLSLSLSLADPWRSRKGRRRRRREGKGKEITRGTLAKEYFNR